MNVENRTKNDDFVKVIQRTIRGYLSRKSNIYLRFKCASVKRAFEQEMNGYHMLHCLYTPVKEALWEELNRNIVMNVCKVDKGANGNHKSGIDNCFDNWRISNKTCKIPKNNVISISSYRLSSVCNNKDPGNIDEIRNEIEKRDSSYDYYSVLFRREHEEHIEYIWCIIPRNYYVFRVENIDKEYGKTGDNVVGWKGSYLSIRFSMSSQLWYKFTYSQIEKYIIHKVRVDDRETITYSDLFEKLLI